MRGAVMERRRTNRVLIIDAQGMMGKLTADAFAAAGWSVRKGARRPGPGQIEIDLDSAQSIAAAVTDDELVVNAVPHPELLAERHVLEHGDTLINVSALPASAGRSLRAVSGAAQGTVLMNAGLAPGPVEAGTDGATDGATEDLMISPSRPRRASWRSPGFRR